MLHTCALIGLCLPSFLNSLGPQNQKEEGHWGMPLGVTPTPGSLSHSLFPCLL